MPSLVYAGNKNSADGTAQLETAAGFVTLGSSGTFTAAEQTALGQSYFLTAAGGGGVSVVNGPPTVQTITIYPYPGATFVLTFGGQSTPAISAMATAGQVQSALQALSSIGANNCTVTGPHGGPYVVTFAGALAGSIQAAIVASGAALSTTPDLSKFPFHHS